MQESHCFTQNVTCISIYSVCWDLCFLVFTSHGGDRRLFSVCLLENVFCKFCASGWHLVLEGYDEGSQWEH